MVIKKGKVLMTIPFIFFLGLTSACLIAKKTTKTLYVPVEFPSLEEAISEAESGDSIMVLPGRYQICLEGILIKQRDLTIFSAKGAKETILLGAGANPVIFFDQNSQATLKGFTITTAEAETTSASKNVPEIPLQGGAIYCAPYSSPRIINNIIARNKAKFGAAIYCAFSSSPLISHNAIISNQAENCGGGIFSFQSSPHIIKNRLIKNSAGNAGGAIFCYADQAIIQNNLIIANKALHSGGGCTCLEAASLLLNNTLSRNLATFGGGVFGFAGEFKLINNILWKNQDDLCLINIKMISRPRFSNISDGDYLGVNGNISQDPLFIDPNHTNYQLKPESPCLHIGDPGKKYNNADGSRNTLGAFGGPQGL